MENPGDASVTDAFPRASPMPPSNVTTSPISYTQSYYSSLYYNMERQGLAVIFNHYEYQQKGYDGIPKRNGTKEDGIRIKRCLKNLNFRVRYYNDPTVKEIGNILDEVAQLKSTDISCLMVVVMTHGDPGILRAYDAEYKIESLWDGLSSIACPALVGVPKLYFIQACRGSKIDPGQVYCDSSSSNDRYKIPAMADFLQMYSTYTDHSSWRDPDGSWFIQSICEILEDVGTEFELLQLLTFVNNKVALEYESRTLDKKSNRMKQIPQIVSMLTKLLRFKKINEERCT